MHAGIHCPLKRLTVKQATTFGRAHEGGVAVTVDLSIGVLVGSAALALDLGRLYNAATELDNAADTAAIAAAGGRICYNASVSYAHGELD